MPGGDIPEDGNQDETGGGNTSGGENPGEGGTTTPITIYDFTLYADAGTNISGIRYTSDARLVSDGDVWRFCNIGTVSFIDKITSIPWSSWDSSTGVRAGSGVVAYHPTIGYMALFVSKLVINETGRVIGVYVVYRPYFDGLDAAIELKTTDIEAPCEGLSMDIPITSKSYTPFQVSTVHDEWCHAAGTAVNGMFMPSRISVTIDPNDSYEPRESRIIVGSVYGKNTIIYVNQAGLPSDDDEDYE